jgi:hypothetical protein
VSVVNLATMRAIQRRTAAEFSDLVDWSAFSLDSVQQAVAARVQGEILLMPFKWEVPGVFGLAMGYQSASRRRWLILYEQDAVAEHQLMIVLHELLHIALGHCAAILTAEELRRELQRHGWMPPDGTVATYSRTCIRKTGHDTRGDSDYQELEAELGAAWIVARARAAGGLPPSGQTFSPEHFAISSVLGGLDDL